MIEFSVNCVLLDIEGTTSSLSFVYDVMFPYVRCHLCAFLEGRWQEPRLMQSLDLVARDLGLSGWQEWLGGLPAEAAQQRVAEEVFRLMDKDAKTTGLKYLQGLVWEDGFRSGQMRAHVYEDVPAALQEWRARGIDLRVYSSGSAHAQRLFFEHTVYGNLSSYFTAHYDTTVGSKRQPDSYRAIATDVGRPPEEILFLSDVVAELDAARTAGMCTALCRRPGNPPPEPHTHPEFVRFTDIRLR